MTTDTIDLAKLEFPVRYEVQGVNLAERVRLLLNGRVQQWQRDGLLKVTPNFGLAVANPLFAGRLQEVWDDPTRLVGYVVGWGPEAHRYVCNAVRKLRPAARQGVDTLFMREQDLDIYFRNTVPSEMNGLIPWGDFPWGGAVFAGMGPTQQLVAVSALTEDEDDEVAAFVAHFLRTETKKLEEAAMTAS